MNTTTKILIGIIVFLLLMLSLSECNRSKVKNQLDTQRLVMDDSLTLTRNKLGQQEAYITNITAAYVDFKQAKLKETDSLGRELQKKVNRRTMSAGVMTSVIEIDTVYSTDTIFYAKGDTMPTYGFNYADDWKTIVARAAADSFTFDLKIREKIEWQTETSRWRLFKPTTCQTKLITHNPDVTITGLRTFTVKCDCAKKSVAAFVMGSGAGFGLGFLGGMAYQKLKR